MLNFYKKINNKNISKKSGFAVLETILYISFFAILSIVVINSMITMMRSFKETKIQSELIQGSSILEKVSREVRQAYAINSISENDLKLNTKDDAGVNKTVRFVLSGNDVQYFENDVLTGNLNPNNVSVSELTFTQIITVEGSAVKITLTISSTNDSLGRTADFYDTVVLRGDYQN
ncbi:MAG: hypothetical protein ABH951_01855 [Patescibacteria group bacterium]